MGKIAFVGFLIILVSVATLLVQYITKNLAEMNLIVPAILLALGFVVFIVGWFMS